MILIMVLSAFFVLASSGTTVAVVHKLNKPRHLPLMSPQDADKLALKLGVIDEEQYDLDWPKMKAPMGPGATSDPTMGATGVTFGYGGMRPAVDQRTLHPMDEPYPINMIAPSSGIQQLQRAIQRDMDNMGYDEDDFDYYHKLLHARIISAHQVPSMIMGDSDVPRVPR